MDDIRTHLRSIITISIELQHLPKLLKKSAICLMLSATPCPYSRLLQLSLSWRWTDETVRLSAFIQLSLKTQLNISEEFQSSLNYGAKSKKDIQCEKRDIPLRVKCYIIFLLPAPNTPNFFPFQYTTLSTILSRNIGIEVMQVIQRKTCKILKTCMEKTPYFRLWNMFSQSRTPQRSHCHTDIDYVSSR